MHNEYYVNHNCAFIMTLICCPGSLHSQISQSALNRLNQIIILGNRHQSTNVVGGLYKQASTINSSQYIVNTTKDTRLNTKSVI